MKAAALMNPVALMNAAALMNAVAMPPPNREYPNLTSCRMKAVHRCVRVASRNAQVMCRWYLPGFTGPQMWTRANVSKQRSR